MEIKKVMNFLHHENTDDTSSQQPSCIFCKDFQDFHPQGGENDKRLLAEYSCEACKFVTNNKANYVTHCLTEKHLRNGDKTRVHFICEKCNYETYSRGDYTKHCSTRKHIALHSDEHLADPSEEDMEFTCETCNKTFQTNAGLWKHSKKCKKHVEDQPVIIEAFKTMQIAIQQAEEREIRRLEMEREKEEREERRNQQIMTTLLEVCKTQSIMNSNNTINNIQNNNIQNNIQNNFNLNLFLNDTCKNAVNLSEFIENVNIEMEDMENYANKGYVEALSYVIIRNLEQLGTERRPIHCTDLKRETIYVKENDKWEKGDIAKGLLQQMVTDIKRANGLYRLKWIDKHPTCIRSDSPYTDIYNRMCCELMGGDSDYATKRGKVLTVQEKENKIMSLIAQAVTIDKSKYC